MKFNLGEPKLSVDVEALIDSRLLVQANSGGGKSWCLRRILEQTHGHVQQLVIDPEGEFGTLREKFDYVYAAKSGGDTAADPRSAKLLAERLLELGVSAVLDIYDLKAHERIRFVRFFLEAMIDARKELWHPVLVVVDEAHVFCPQKGEAESAGAVIDLCTRGRKRGYCAVLATQRLSKLHKDAAAELNNKLIGRTGLDVDMARAAEELGFTGRDERLQLRGLARGHFFAFGPAISEAVTRVHVGPVVSRHPEAGARIAFAPPPPTAKVRALLPKLADLPAEAEKRERSLDDLHAENAKLKRELVAADKRVPAPAASKTVTVDRPVITKADVKKLTDAAKVISKLRDELHYKIEWLDNQVVRPLMAVLDPMFKGQVAPVVVEKPGRSGQVGRPAPALTPPQKVVVRELRAITRKIVDTANGALPKGERAVLIAIAQHGTDGVSREQLTVLTGYKRSTRDAYLQRLRERDFIASDTGLSIVVTDTGVDALGHDFTPLPTGDELRAYWLQRLPSGERQILEVLVGVYPTALPRTTLDDTIGFKRSTRDAYLQRLGSRRLVEFLGRGEVRASAMLYTNGGRA
jgi:hypothetical protein